MKLFIRKFFFTLLLLFNVILIFSQEYKFTEKCELFTHRITPGKTEYSSFFYGGDKSPIVYMTENN